MSQKNKAEWQRTYKVALGLNIATIVCVCLGLIFIFAKLYPDGVFSQYGLINLKFYSMIVNIIGMAMAITMVVFLTKLKKRKIVQIPQIVHLLNFVVTSGLLFNLLMDVVYLLPVCIITKSYEVEWLFTGTNMLFYIFVPLLAGFQFIFALPKCGIKFKQTFLGIALPCLYFLIYLIIGLCNIQKNGSISSSFDFYGFGHFNAGYIALAFIAIIGLSYLSSWFTWYANRKSFITKKIITLSLNVVILFMCVVSIIWLFYNAISTSNAEINIIQNVGKRFLYFTNWTLFLMTVAVCISVSFDVWLLIGKKKEVPLWVNCVKLAAVTAMAIILFLELFLAAPVIYIKEGINRAWRLCFGHHLMFMHLLIPIFAIFTYIVVENNNMTKKWIWVCSCPLLLYSLIYMIIIYCHINVKTSIDVWWDVYNIRKYVSYGAMWLLPIGLYGLNVFFTWLIWTGNHKVNVVLEKNNQNIQTTHK